ncbi:hypothetical protein ACIP4Y_13075 [Streptomyces sp. NPDC088810]|uniref:hypothetical protein n=1 Tax=unclassified Streptomyces TaxID=2593676 RepID=UPI0037F7E160
MPSETLHAGLTLDAELLEELLTSSEEAVSDAPLPCPEGGVGVLILGLALSPKQPKEPKEPGSK